MYIRDSCMHLVSPTSTSSSTVMGKVSLSPASWKPWSGKVGMASSSVSSTTAIVSSATEALGAASQPEVTEPLQPVLLENLRDRGGPVHLRFKTNYKAALPPALYVCVCSTELFFTVKGKKRKKEKRLFGKNGIHMVVLFHFLRNLHADFHNGYSSLHSHQQGMSVPFCPHPHQHFLFHVFW